MLRIWNVATGSLNARINGHNGWVRALAVTPDGCLVSSAWDATVKLWDVTHCKEITRLNVGASILSLASLKNGKLVVGDSFGRIHWLNIVM